MTVIEQSAAALLDADRLKQDAVGRIGHDDFGTGWEEGYDLLLSALHKLDMSLSSAQRAARQIGVFLDARLYANRGFAQYPQALDVPIVKPIVIAGLVRSGTTVLHKILSLDPQFQAPQHWLTMAPMPRPPVSEWRSVSAYRNLAGLVEDNLEISPELIEHHGISVDDAEETLFIQAQTFCSNIYPSMYDVPDYDRWFQSTDERPHYRYIAKILKLIGANEPEKRWLLKNPTDLFSLDAVLDTFSDAMVIQTHRDPIQSVPSVCGTILSGRRMVQDEPQDPARLGARESRFWADALRRAEDARTKHNPPAIDIEFHSFMADQLGTVRQIYDHFGLTLSAESEGRMQAWLDANPRRSASLQRVAPEEFGLTHARLADQYADYRSKRGYA